MIADPREPAVDVRCVDATRRHVKTRYYSREIAELYARRYGMRAYRCPFCGWFHHTTRPAA
jgi:hypothetical protein